MSFRTWTLRRRLTALFATSAVLAVVVLVIGVVAFADLLDARSRVVDEADPAAVAQRDLLAALVDQETGVRGFTLTGDESFHEPYVNGDTAAARATARLHEILTEAGGLDERVQAVEARAEAWRTEFAEPEIARVRQDGPGEAAESVQAIGRERFDAVRAELDVLEGDLSEARVTARDDLEHATSLLVASLIAIAVVVVVVGALAFLAFRRWMMDPNDRLAAGTRTVTSGALRHELVPDGPPEIRRLGSDVEDMRRRIKVEVATVEAARVELDERARELLRSNSDLEQFAYVASHDLQEPLRKVTSFCQLLQRRYADQLDERANQYIDFAVDGARRMQVLINDLLTFSRVGRTTDAFVPVHLDDVVSRAASDLEEAVTASEAKIERTALPTVHGDPTLLLMLFRNLIGNAIKFRGEDPPVVQISAERDDAERVWRLVVADNGIGIEPAYAEKVFVIFQRLHARDSYEGTGIGLAVAKRIVEYHGGTIRLDTTRARGAAFLFTIPQSPLANDAMDRSTK
jgi:signal transduction histidine kinase